MDAHHNRGGSGNLKMVRPLTNNGFNGGGLARCDIKLYIIITTELDISQADSIIFGSYQVNNQL